MQLWVAIVAPIALGLVMGFQILLAAGFQFGQAACRHPYKILSPAFLLWAADLPAALLRARSRMMMPMLVYPRQTPRVAPL